jgi:hypothetical protein
VLSGRVVPSGRLPVEMPASPGGQPSSYLRPRLADRHPASSVDPTPLFAFGHGLSYTTFEYSDPIATIALDSADGPTDQGSFTVTVEVTVTNVGDVTGDEVAQLYSHAVDASVPTPLRKLQGFERIRLEPGESRTVAFEVPGISLAHWSEQDACFVGEPGDYEFSVGRSSTDLPASVTVPCGKAVRLYR